jgi:hypothetical protein
MRWLLAVGTSASGGRTLPPIVTVGPLLGRTTQRRVGLLAVTQGPAHFEPLAERCLTGEMTIDIDRTFRLDDVPEALAPR